MSKTPRSRTQKATSTWDRDTAPETNNQDKEIQRRIMAGWTAFAKHRDIFKGNIGSCLKRQIYKSCVLPAMTYGAETWALTTQVKNKLAAAQTKIERSMLNIIYRDRKTNIWVREKTKVTDMIGQVRRRKWSWAGHISWTTDGHCVSSLGHPTKGKDLEEVISNQIKYS